MAAKPNKYKWERLRCVVGTDKKQCAGIQRAMEIIIRQRLLSPQMVGEPEIK